jgi:hypothetical protein
LSSSIRMTGVRVVIAILNSFEDAPEDVRREKLPD